MIFIILFLSGVFISLGFIVTEKNAKYLLAGYNTATEEQQKNVKLVPLIGFFRRFHLILGIIVLAVSLSLYFFVSEEWGGVFAASFPLVVYPYFMWKSNSYVYKSSKTNKVMLWIMSAILLAIAAFIIIDAIREFAPIP